MQLLYFRKCCPCVLLRARDYCVSHIVGMIKSVKSVNLFLKHITCPSTCLSTGADPEGPGTMASQTTMFAIANNSVKTFFT